MLFPPVPIPSMNAVLDDIFGWSSKLIQRGNKYEGSVGRGQTTLRDEFESRPPEGSVNALTERRGAGLVENEGNALEDARRGHLSGEANPVGNVDGSDGAVLVTEESWSSPDDLRFFRSRLVEPSKDFLFRVVMPDCDDLDNWTLASGGHVGIPDHTRDVLQRCVSAQLPSWAVTERIVRVGSVNQRIPERLEVYGKLTLKLIEGIDQKTKMWVYRWLNSIFIYTGESDVSKVRSMAVLGLHPTSKKPVGGVILYRCFPVGCSFSDMSMSSGGISEVTVDIVCSDMFFGDVKELLRILNDDPVWKLALDV